MKKWLCAVLSVLVILSAFSACSKPVSKKNEETTVESNNEKPIPAVDTSSPEKVAEAYLEALTQGDYGKLTALKIFDLDMMEEAFAADASSQGLSLKQYYDKLCADLQEAYDEGSGHIDPDFEDFNGYISYLNTYSGNSIHDKFSGEYGSDYTITIEIFEKTKLSENDIADYKKQINDEIVGREEEYSFDIDFTGDDIEEFIAYRYNITVKGSDGEWSTAETGESEIHLAKNSDEWKVIYCSHS